jgi:hypothetical protein
LRSGLLRRLFQSLKVTYCRAICELASSYPRSRASSNAVHAEASYARLHAAGWSIGETGTGAAVLVTGTNGEDVIHMVE